MTDKLAGEHTIKRHSAPLRLIPVHEYQNRMRSGLRRPIDAAGKLETIGAHDGYVFARFAPAPSNLIGFGSFEPGSAGPRWPRVAE